MEETASIEKTVAGESSTGRPRFIRRVHYWWSLFVAGALLGLLGPPILIVAWILRKHDLVYPVALFGAGAWLKLSGVSVKVTGLERLDPKQTYIFVSNHRSYLDTATLFIYTGRRIGLLAKKELLKVPVLGVGMGFVNVMAIDRSNRESAISTTDAAAKRIHLSTECSRATGASERTSKTCESGMPARAISQRHLSFGSQSHVGEGPRSRSVRTSCHC